MPKRIIFDIETNAIKDFNTLCGLKTCHCIAMSIDGEEPKIMENGDALQLMQEAEMLIGHNIMKFDLRALKRLYPDFNYQGEVRDTLVMSRLLFGDLMSTDHQAIEFPRKLMGSHSLKAWGVRLGIHKGDFGEDTDWSCFTPEMAEYCKQDVAVTAALWKRIQEEDPDFRPTQLEHDFAAIIHAQEIDGFVFDGERARALHSTLLDEKCRIKEQLQEVFPPAIIQLKTKTKEVPFNPGSRKQIAERLIEKYGWEPADFTESGQPKVDESVLTSLHYPEAKLVARYLLVNKRLGQLAEGENAWLKLEKGGKIHGSVNPCGCVSTRCTHSKPNMAQVPSVGSPWGKECRELFTVEPGNVLVGADMSGLELRMLAHYVHPYDQGRYTAEILDGDIHTANQEAAGLETRNQAKTFIYAFLYGAGDEKIGSIVGGGRTAGRRIKKQFLQRMPGIQKLQQAIKTAVRQRPHLVALDGRKLKIRSEHSALNLLLQSAGSIAMKKATVNLWNYISHMPDIKARQVAHVHDEMQIECRESQGDEVGKLAVDAMKDAGDDLGVKCPLTGEYKIGYNWAETH